MKNYNSTKNLIICAIIAVCACFMAVKLTPAAAADAAAVPAKSMIVMEAKTNRVLFEHNAYAKLPMASTTKILTAITAIEACDIDKVISVPKAACGVEGSSIYLEEGEKLTVRQLTYGLMLQSGNDCAAAIAIHVGGSIEGFAKLMNEKCQLIEAYDSHFVNPHGLHHNDHYTTSYDLALISAYAMQNDVFREIVCTKRIKIPWTTRNYDRIVVNKNKMLSQYAGATGIKTGFTKAAGRCLVSSAVRDGMELVCVVLNCGPMWEVSMRYMDMIFDKYHVETILQPYTYWGEVNVAKRKEEKVGVYSKDKLEYPLCQGEEAKITSKLEVPEKVAAPLAKDTEIGKIKFYYDNHLIFSAKVFTISSVDKMSFFEAIQKILAEM